MKPLHRNSKFPEKCTQSLCALFLSIESIASNIISLSRRLWYSALHTPYTWQLMVHLNVLYIIIIVYHLYPRFMLLLIRRWLCAPLLKSIVLGISICLYALLYYYHWWYNTMYGCIFERLNTWKCYLYALKRQIEAGFSSAIHKQTFLFGKLVFHFVCLLFGFIVFAYSIIDAKLMLNYVTYG